MRQIKKSILSIGLIIATCFFMGCKTELNINHYIDKKIPLKLAIKTKDSTTGLSVERDFEIGVNSFKYKKILVWGDANVKGWTKTIASYSPDVFVEQRDFRLLTLLDGNSVVVGFKDNNGKARQYIKAVKSGDLDFLKK